MQTLRKDALPDISYCIKKGWASTIPSEPLRRMPRNKMTAPRKTTIRPCACGSPGVKRLSNNDGICAACLEKDAKRYGGKI